MVSMSQNGIEIENNTLHTAKLSKNKEATDPMRFTQSEIIINVLAKTPTNAEKGQNEGLFSKITTALK